MKHEKKYEILSGLDERLLEDALRNREKMMRPTVNRRTERFRRVVLLCACLTLLCASLVVMGVVGLSMVTGDKPGETDAPNNPPSDVEWVEDPNIVQVQRLSVSKSFDIKNMTTTTDNTITVNTERYLGQRLILLSFHCREGESITVNPGADGALFEVAQMEINQKLYWSIWNEEAAEYHLAEEYLRVNTQDNLTYLGQAVTITKDAVLLWQYPDFPRPCVEDNFVDFTITDSEGSIKGGGSIYIGGLDLTTVSENKTYYSTSRGPSNVNLNAAYRPVLLGAYRYAEGTEVDAEIHAQKLSALRETAAQARAHLFDDLSDDDFRLSYRTLLYKYGANMKPGISVTTLHADPAYDRYAVVTAGKEQKQFFLYDGFFNDTATTEIYTADEYGYTVTGKLTLADGTVVMVDINDPERMYEIILPNE